MDRERVLRWAEAERLSLVDFLDSHCGECGWWRPLATVLS